MTNTEILKSALRQIHFRSDFNIGGEWDEALDGLIAELEQAKRDALPCQVLDVLDSERRAQARLSELEARLETASRVGHLAAAQEVIERAEAERDRYREALEKIAFKTRDYAPTLESCQRIAKEALTPKP